MDDLEALLAPYHISDRETVDRMVGGGRHRGPVPDDPTSDTEDGRVRLPAGRRRAPGPPVEPAPEAI